MLVLNKRVQQLESVRRDPKQLPDFRCLLQWEFLQQMKILDTNLIFRESFNSLPTSNPSNKTSVPISEVVIANIDF